MLGVALLLWTLRPQTPTPSEIRERARIVLGTSLRSASPDVRVLAARALGLDPGCQSLIEHRQLLVARAGHLHEAGLLLGHLAE